MHAMNAKKVNLDTRLKMMFVLLVGSIVAGNGLLLWQFHSGQLQAKRVTRVSEQMAAVLRLQGSLLSFHKRLGELAQLRDAAGLETESNAGRRALTNQLQQTRVILTPLPTGGQTDPLLLPTLDTIEVSLPAQLESIIGLASLGDWNAVNFRIGERLNPFEIEASILVKSVDQHFVAEIAQSQTNMKSVQDRILILLPLTAIYSFAIATLFAWVIARRILELRFEERVNERTRIARDLHDTLLQSFHGLLLSFRAVYDQLPLHPKQAKESLGRAIDEAGEAITEGRDAVQGLRSSTVESNDIAEAIRAIAEELAAERNELTCATFQVEVSGMSRSLDPMIRDEVYRIAGEALRNAFRHAQAKQIEVEVRYDDREFQLRVRDNGRGINSRILNGDGRSGHFGLHGMRERAQLSGGKLTVWSEVDSGTEVEMTIPAPTAYAASAHRFRWSDRLFRYRAEEKRMSKS